MKRKNSGTQEVPAPPERVEAQANRAARDTAIGVLVVGLLIVVLPALLQLGTVLGNPFEAPTTTKVVTERVNGVEVKSVTTTSESPQSLLERGLASGGLLLLRVGIVALASFLAGAVVQRIMLGDFQLKLGPLELPALQRLGANTEKSIENLTGAVAENKDVTEKTARAVAQTATELQALQARVATLSASLGNSERDDRE